MHLRLRLTLFLGVAALLAGAPPTLCQEWRGQARVEGVVKNEKREPIEGAKVSLRWKQHTDGPNLTTDKKGRWSMLGLIGGSWKMDVQAAGYQRRQITVEVTEADRNPLIETRLQPVPQAPPAPAKVEEQILVGGKKISKEAADAIEGANAALEAKKYAEARELYAKALPELPDNAPLLMRLGAACYADGKPDEAIKYVRQAADLDPTNPAPWRMIAEIELQRGNLEAGQAALAKVPEDMIKNGQTYLNMGILLLNKKKGAESEVALTKAIRMQPDLADAYYMRALARYQLKKYAETKADLQKYLELSPNGAEANEAKDILKTIK